MKCEPDAFAHPSVVKDPNDEAKIIHVELGLTKREYFAAMALQGMLASNFWGEDSLSSIATHAALMSDTMIKEISK